MKYKFTMCIKRILAVILAVSISTTLTGCWNAREINELAFVLSLALDKADEGFKVTVQIAKPDTYSKTQTSQGSTDKEKSFWVITETGKTIFEAVRNMASFSSRRIFWSHIKVIIIGEELAKNNIREIFDFFSRNPELRFRTWVAVAPGEAGKILEVTPIMEKDPASNIEKIIDKTQLASNSYSIMLKDFLEDYMDPYLSPVASRIILDEIDSKQIVKLNGAAVFSGDRMAGWLDENQARGLLWFKDKINGSIRVVKCPYDDLPITLEIKTGKIKIKSKIDNGIPHYTISVKAKCKITEKACNTELRNPEAMRELQSALDLAINEDIQAIVKAAKKLDSDILDFSGTLHRQHKKEWAKLAPDWPRLFRESEIKIAVETTIPEISLLAKSLTPIKKASAKGSR